MQTLQLIFLLLVYAVGLVALDYSSHNNKKLLYKYYNYSTLYTLVTYYCLLYVLGLLR